MSVGLGWVHPVGGFPEHNLLVGGWDLLVATVLRASGCAPPPSSSPVEAEWIWDSEEVINLHIGDMSAE